MTDAEFLQIIALLLIAAGTFGIGSWLGKKFEGDE